MADFEIIGTKQFDRLSRELKGAGDELRREVGDSIREAGRSTPARVRQRALATLPRSGGLAGLVAGSSFTMQETSAGDSVGVRVEASSGLDLEAIDRGSVHHPGGSDQSVPEGWFSRAVEDEEPRLHDAVEDAVRATANRIERKL